MANVLTDAAEALAEAFEAVLPGRVTAEPRTTDVGEAIWIDMPTVTPDKPVNARHMYADFPVHITAAGVDRAQAAFLNDAVAKVWDACDRLRLTYPVVARPMSRQPGEDRGVIVTVRVLLQGMSLCLPDAPDAAPIPPDPITNPASEED